MDGKTIVNAIYHGAVVAGLAAGYAQVGKMVMGIAPPKLDFTNKPRDAALLVAEVAMAIEVKDFLIKRQILPADIWK